MDTQADWIRTRICEIESQLGRLIGREAPYALLDWPNHSNVGDSAIWLGEMNWARRFFGKLPCYVSPSGTRATGLDRYCPEGPILLHGGGNFGDIWRSINDRRVELLQNHRHRRIIQLPQSIHFSSPDELTHMQRAIGAHPNFILLVRDNASLQFARDHFECESWLCPDMALMLGALARPLPPREQVICLLRTDRECAIDDALAAPGPADDWLAEKTPLMTWNERLWQHIFREALKKRAHQAVMRPLMHQNITMKNRLAEERLQRGMRFLSQGRQVVTDRLHGHILSTLMGIPHIALDNSYRKISNFINSWPPDNMTAIAADMSDARAILKRQRTASIT